VDAPGCGTGDGDSPHGKFRHVESYAARKGMIRAEIERWLAPNLAYEVE